MRTLKSIAANHQNHGLLRLNKMLIKLIRLGRDSELRTTQSGQQVLNFAGAYDIGFGDKKRTQWIDCALWGDRAAKVQQHLTKGTQIVIYADDVELEQFTKSDGSAGAKIKCSVRQFDFTGSRNDSNAPPTAAAPVQAPPQAAPQSAPSGFNNFDDDIPF